MTELNIQATERTPAITLNGPPWQLHLQGESYPEDVSSFYGPLILAIDELVANSQHPLQAQLNLVYINSSSIKALYRIFESLETYRQKGQNVRVIWRYTDDDDIMQELGEDFQDRFPQLHIAIEAQ
jgi:hypothetical protein